MRLRLNVSPDLQFNTFAQYDNASNSIGSNRRIRWTFSPPGDLFIVYNHNINTLGDRRTFDSNSLLVKLQYAFRF